MGQSGETSEHGFLLLLLLFFAVCNINVQSKERFDNQFIPMYVFILAL